MRPPRQYSVDVAQGWVKSRFIVAAVVVDPSTDMIVEHPRQIIQRLVAALVECPVTDSLPDRLESFAADSRTERDAKPVPSARQPRPERIAEEVELMVREVAASVIVLAIDDFRFIRM